MVYEGTTDLLNAIPMTKLAINNSVQDSTGLFSEYIKYRTLIRMPVDFLYRV